MATTKATKPIIVDGGILEGGGQILRLAASLSTLLDQPITVNNIRAGRVQGGLKAQHLMGLRLVGDICGAKLEGAAMGSTAVTFSPGPIKSGNFEADTKTAGSVVLLLQVSMPCLLFAPATSQLTLRGGTNAEMAPHIDYMTMVFKPIVEKMGIHFELTQLVRGFFPKGGGTVKITVDPVRGELKPITLTDRGEITHVTGRAFVAGTLPMKLAHQMADEAVRELKYSYPHLNVDITRIKETPQDAVGNGAAIVLVAHTSTGCKIGGSAVGKVREDVRDISRRAARELAEQLDAHGCVDKYLQDQLVIFMALAGGKSSVLCGPLTLHTQTALYMARLLTQAKFHTEEQPNKTVLLTCEGVGLRT